MTQEGRVLSRKEALRIMGTGVSVPFILGGLTFHVFAAEKNGFVDVTVIREKAVSRLSADSMPTPFLIRPYVDEEGKIIGGEVLGVEKGLAEGAFRDGDIILTIDGRSIVPVDKETVEAEEKLALENAVKGKSISVELLRDGKPLTYNFKFK